MKKCPNCNKDFKDVQKTAKLPICKHRPKKSGVKAWQMLILVTAILLFIAVFAVLIFGGDAPPDDIAASSAVSDVAEIKSII